MTVLSEIADWQVEARNEDPHRYFYHRSDFERITEGKISYIIGRKGSGKTAIVEQLSQRDFNTFSRKLSFSNFPFGLLYSKADESFSYPHQYVSIWRYVIYRYICSMMVQNATIASRLDKAVIAALEIEVNEALELAVEKITGKGLGASILSVSGNYESQSERSSISISDANEVLSDFIWSNVDDCEYFVLFDELDEDYARVLEAERKEQYFSLIVGLFKAVDLISGEARRCGRRVMPIVFLRDDIFELCPSQDRNKWLDKALYLKWSPQQLENLLKFRLFRAAYPDDDQVELGDGWNLAFSVHETRYGSNRKKKKATFRHLLDHTFNRPRDIVHIVRSAAKQSIDMGQERIDNAAISDSDVEHSRYMKREVQAELLPIVEENELFFEALSAMGKQIFRFQEFKERLAMTFNTHAYKCPLTDAQVARLLYRFNVIGNEKAGRRFFLYNSSSRSVDLDGQLCVHRGLLKALDVY